MAPALPQGPNDASHPGSKGRGERQIKPCVNPQSTHSSRRQCPGKPRPAPCSLCSHPCLRPTERRPPSLQSLGSYRKACRLLPTSAGIYLLPWVAEEEEDLHINWHFHGKRASTQLLARDLSLQWKRVSPRVPPSWFGYPTVSKHLLAVGWVNRLPVSRSAENWFCFHKKRASGIGRGEG